MLQYNPMMKIEVVQKWVHSAKEDLEVAHELRDGKRYAYCLFFCQLSLEKILKAVIVNIIDDAPPITHDLVKLAGAAKLSPVGHQEAQLREITSFNIEARYDIYKERLYKKATPEFTNTYLAITEELFLWIQNNLQ